ncbi:PLP-dependent aminotransferase family protein [Marinomonas transparens]|uniref:PLP-dependent aminotransferase family protein n=1 Tax=Marinomonas transparens TaxID=2795388 RepID=A0A934JS41_9GAMM|nr:PLP-dependent aminotransferase family protein [Marinomonas transparens]MBJ7537347.1 PLP-dependent aminotransferase family protein [Marinomonas transparens]
MNDCLISMEFQPGRSFQQQIREKLVDLIQKDYFGTSPLPSSRKMAQLLGVSRNTVMLVYESLVDENFLISRERSGYFVNPDVGHYELAEAQDEYQEVAGHDPIWSARLKTTPSRFNTLNKDKNWITYSYPFIYGQIEPTHFPLYQWRECTRIAQSRSCVHEWIEDYIDIDSKELISQIRQHILPKRGITAAPEEILITLGTQNSLSLLASLLTNEDTLVGLEDPGYADQRHIFDGARAKLTFLDLDQNGLVLGPQLSACDYLCVTPSHQYPTTVTMPIERRIDLLKQANQDDFIIIEDDYESEVNFHERPLQSLKSMDQNDRVIYTGSLSKSLSPGLRMGYLVANKALIKELRVLRRLQYRHPPANNQSVTALFIGQGYYDSHLRRMRVIYEMKWNLMSQGIKKHLKGCEVHETKGSFCFWIGLPAPLLSQDLVRFASSYSILVESGDSLFARESAPKNYIRLGFSAIPENKIEQGLETLGQLIQQLLTSSPQQRHQIN